MALFGYPVAQENDAERAVRAALSIQRALAELNRKNEGAGKPALAARIAIDTGPAVLDAGGEIFGDVANVAARAQALADPGAVVTARVQRQVAGLFVAEECGNHVHRSLLTIFGQDLGVHALVFRSRANWVLGYPRAALADAEHAVSDARQIGQAATLMSALGNTVFPFAMCGNYAAAQALLDDLASLADEKGASFWKATAILGQAYRLAGTGKTTEAVQMFASGIAARRSTGATLFIPWYLLRLARAYAELDGFTDAWRCISEAIATVEETGERWCEAEVYRTAGEIGLISPQQDTAKAEPYFERALAVARKQQAKSWELRAAMSMARLWRDQGKRTEARELLARRLAS
jgi:predicted ATPase